MKIYVDFSMSASTLELLRQETMGHELLFPKNPASSVLTKPEPDPQFAAAEIAFGQPNPQAVADAQSLKWIHISTSGITRYDNPEFRDQMARRGIQVTNSAGVYYEACAVHALSFLLAQARHLPAALQMRAPSGAPEWTALRNASTTLRGETVLILGYGAIGRRLAELLAPFGVDIVAYRRKPRGDEGVQVVTEKDLAPVLAKAHHIVNILPDTPETHAFFNVARFAATRAGASFYNIGRGITVDQTALLEALRSHHIGAAWLDVTTPEPLADNHPLRQQPNCFVTPHVAGGHPDEFKALVRHFTDNFKRFLANQPLVDRVM